MQLSGNYRNFKRKYSVDIGKGNNTADFLKCFDSRIIW